MSLDLMITEILDFLALPTQDRVRAREAIQRIVGKHLAYNLVLTEIADDSFAESFDSKEKLVDRLREAIRDRRHDQAFVFRGQRLHTTVGPNIFLVVDDEQIPLFDVQPDTTPDISNGGYIRH